MSDEKKDSNYSQATATSGNTTVEFNAYNSSRYDGEREYVSVVKVDGVEVAHTTVHPSGDVNFHGQDADKKQ